MDKPLEEWWNAFLSAAQEDKYQWLLEDVEVVGGGSLDGLGHHLATTKLEVLSLILTYRRMNHTDESGVHAFLKRQQYGGSSAEWPSQYCLTILGPGPPVSIFVTEIDELDLEDLYDSMEFESLTVQHLHKSLTKSAIDELVEQIMTDLTYGGNELEAEIERCDDDTTFTLFLTAT